MAAGKRCREQEDAEASKQGAGLERTDGIPDLHELAAMTGAWPHEVAVRA